MNQPIPRKAAVIAFLWAFASIFFWGVMFPVGKALMESGEIAASTVAMLRFLIASPVLFAAGFALHGRTMVPHGWRDWASLAALGLVGAALMALLLFLAQPSVSSVAASLLEAYVPVQVLLIGIVAGRGTTPKQVAGIVLGFVGCLFVLRALDGGGLRLGALSRGDLLIFLSGLCWSLYTYLGRPLIRRIGSFPFSAWTILFGGIWLLAYNLASGIGFEVPSTRAGWGRVLFLAIFPTCVSFYGWNAAQKGMSISHLAFMEYFTPLVAALFGLMFLGEDVTAWQWLGVAVVIASARLQ